MSLNKIHAGWVTGRLCEDEECKRLSNHFPGEYGCIVSDVWRAPSPESFEARCSPTRYWHVRGCGCPGDPIAHCNG